MNEFISVRVDGIPCQAEVKVEHFSGAPVRNSVGRLIEPDERGWGWELVSLRDRKGYPALWLEKKLESDKIYRNLEEQIDNHISLNFS